MPEDGKYKEEIGDALEIHPRSLFYQWNIYLMGPFPSSYGKKYVLVAINYVSIWVEAIALPMNKSKQLLKRISLEGLGVPKLLSVMAGKHFYNKLFSNLLEKCGVTHKVVTAYHPQSYGKVEMSNREFKIILKDIVNANRKECSNKLDDALWAYRTANKTPIETCLYILVFEKP